MCVNCWKEMGAPQLDTPAVREAAALIAGVYEFNGVGSYLHCAIDDWNIDGDLSFEERQVERAEAAADRTGRVEEVAACRKCLDALKKLTVDERASALAMHDGYFTPASV